MFYLILIVIIFGVMGSYGYFTWQESVVGNRISVGGYIENNMEIRMYASIGPLYDNAMSENFSSNRSSNYPGWLINTSRYIAGDVENEVIPEAENTKRRFVNILSNEGLTTSKATIASRNHQSWMGSTESDVAGNENGTMLHLVIGISNEANSNENSNSIYCKKIQLSIRQLDVYEDCNGKKYEFYQSNSSKGITINLSDKPYQYRTKAYNWSQEDGRYIEETNIVNGMDLIIFDIGSRPNVTYESSINKEQGMLDIYERITGIRDHYSSKGSSWNENSYMYYHTSPSSSDFQLKDTTKAKLIAIKTEVTLKYDGEVIETLDPYIINIGE